MDDEMIKRISEAILNTPNASDYKTLVAINAVKAMKEPTDHMHKAMCDAYFNSPAAIWMAGIDAVIND